MHVEPSCGRIGVVRVAGVDWPRRSIVRAHRRGAVAAPQVWAPRPSEVPMQLWISSPQVVACQCFQGAALPLEAA